MAITFRNNIGAYTGVGRKLTVAEGDGNVHDHELRILSLEGSTGKQILNVTGSGTALTVNYTDTTSDGPFLLPIATFNPVGFWTNDTPYAYLDVVRVPTLGTFVAMVDHTSPSPPEEFDPGATEENSDGSDLLWFQIGEAHDTDNDVAFSFMGVLPEAASNTGTGSDTSTEDDVLLGQFVLIHDSIMETPLTIARSFLNTPPAVSDVEINITKNGVTIGTIVHQVDAEFGSFIYDDDVEFPAGSRVGIVLMAADGFARDLSVTLPMRRTDI